MKIRKSYIIMGVSGCGKTTIGQLLANEFDFNFYDGDDFHPQSNIDKMTKGEKLNDEDRRPWLEAINKHILEQEDVSIYACSALKEKYRKILSKNNEAVVFIYLKGDFDLIYDRMSKRKNHFMPAELLQSQFSTLEEPYNAIVVDINQSQESILHLLKKELK